MKQRSHHIVLLWVIFLFGCDQKPSDFEIKTNAALKLIASGYSSYAAKYGNEETKTLLEEVAKENIGILEALHAKSIRGRMTFNSEDISIIPPGGLNENEKGEPIDAWKEALLIKKNQATGKYYVISRRYDANDSKTRSLLRVEVEFK